MSVEQSQDQDQEQTPAATIDQVEALNKFSKDLLNAGRIELIQHYGSDAMNLRAARVSYNGDLLKKARSGGRRSTLRYLIRNHHTSPFEHNGITFLIEVPMFIRSQWHRHRTQSYNEISRRYTDANEGDDDNFFFPDYHQFLPQSLDNKQGRAEVNMTPEEYGKWVDFATDKMIGAYSNAHKVYKELLAGMEISGAKIGMARELARSVLPVGTYTRYYATANLLNWYRFISLRSHGHAQYEIRVFSDAILETLRQLFPVSTEAFEDYWLNAVTFSRMEMDIVRKAYHAAPLDAKSLIHPEMDDREMSDLAAKLKLGRGKLG